MQINYKLVNRIWNESFQENYHVIEKLKNIKHNFSYASDIKDKYPNITEKQISELMSEVDSITNKISESIINIDRILKD